MDGVRKDMVGILLCKILDYIWKSLLTDVMFDWCHDMIWPWLFKVIAKHVRWSITLLCRVISQKKKMHRNDLKTKSQCANHLYANWNLRYSKWWPSFLLCCFWRVFCVYEELILLWFCLLDSIFKQHYYLRQFIWSEVLCFSISCLNHQTLHEFRCITCVLVTWH